MLRVLTYHRVARPGETPDLDPAIVSATPEAFRSHMRHLVQRYHPIDLDTAMAAFTRGGSLPDRAVLVTFDDAYRCFGEIAWPIMKELGVPATVFVPTAYPSCPERSFWWDRLYRAVTHGRGSPGARPLALAPDLRLDVDGGLRRAGELLKSLPHDEAELLVDRVCNARLEARSANDAVLGWEELAELAREGVAFGAHTHHHVALPNVSPRRRHVEIRRSLDDVAWRLGARHRVLAYPYGLVDDETVEVARSEGCALAFTTEDGLNRPGRVDPLRLYRTNVTPRTTARLFPLRMAPWFASLDRWRHRKKSAGAGA